MTITMAERPAIVPTASVVGSILRREPFRAASADITVSGKWIPQSASEFSLDVLVEDRTPVRVLNVLTEWVLGGDTYVIFLDGFPVAWYSGRWHVPHYELPSVEIERLRDALRAALIG